MCNYISAGFRHSLHYWMSCPGFYLLCLRSSVISLLWLTFPSVTVKAHFHGNRRQSLVCVCVFGCRRVSGVWGSNITQNKYVRMNLRSGSVGFREDSCRRLRNAIRYLVAGWHGDARDGRQMLVVVCVVNTRWFAKLKTPCIRMQEDPWSSCRPKGKWDYFHPSAPHVTASLSKL